MYRPPLVRRTVVVLISVFALLTPAATALAAAPADMPAVLARWTQPGATSATAWYAASLARDPWSEYGFDWSTDHCSSSPDRPLGFDFRRSCQRHDFGYRNYKAAGEFSANKARLDTGFLADLKRLCATYDLILRPACLSLAWTYYAAVDVFGSTAAVSQADLDRAAKLKADALGTA
jgi:hypothetical protein